MTFKPMLFNASGPPADEQISRVVAFGSAHVPRGLQGQD